MKPLIVIPAYNEVASVARVVEAARVWAPVIVVDDGSTDGTAAAATAAGADVISHRRQLGKGQAIRTGVAATRARGASVMVTLDADGQHDPDDVPLVLAAIRQSPRAIVIASRRRDESALPRSRRNALRIAAFFVDWTGDVSVRDTQSGFRAYPVSLFDELTLKRGGFVFETEVLLAAAAAGWSIVEVDIRALAGADRRSRFRPVIDGAAIATYLGRQVLARWGVELATAAREVASVAGRDRRRARHAVMIQSAALYADSPGTWAFTIGVTACRRAAVRLSTWWRHPRLRRAALAARVTLAAPVVLAAAAVQSVGGRWLPDLVTPIVDGVFSIEALAGITASVEERSDAPSSFSIAEERLTTGPASPP